ncbi:MAG: DUF6531 domain-containing protein [Panacagrimonas sp.]
MNSAEDCGYRPAAKPAPSQPALTDYCRDVCLDSWRLNMAALRGLMRLVGTMGLCLLVLTAGRSFAQDYQNPDGLGVLILGFPESFLSDFLFYYYGQSNIRPGLSGGPGFRGGLFTAASPDPGEAGAPIGGCQSTPNPVHIRTGNKFLREVDWQGRSGEMPLSIDRTYNRQWTGRSIFGPAWLSGFDYKLAFVKSDQFGYPTPGSATTPTPNGATTGLTKVYVDRPDGARYSFLFEPARNRWEDSKPDSMAYLVRDPATGRWTLRNEDRSVEIYNDNGHVLSVTNEFGIGWTFTYLAKYKLDRVTHTSGRFIQLVWTDDRTIDRVTQIRDSAGSSYGYTYLGLYLSGVNSPGEPAVTRTYHYESLAGEVTGISVNDVRHTTYAYQGSTGNRKARESGLVDGIEKLSFTYDTDASDPSNPKSFTEITNARGAVTTYEFHAPDNAAPQLRHVRRSSVTNCPDAAAETEYDDNGFIDYEVDWNGNKTDYTYKARGQLRAVKRGIHPAFPGKGRLTRMEWEPGSDRL